MKRNMFVGKVVVMRAKAAYAGFRMKGCGTLQIGLVVGLLLGTTAITGVSAPNDTPDESLRAELKNYPYRIVHESYRDGRWVLAMIDADGSNPAVLTRTLETNELYPHVSPNGKQITFECDEGVDKQKRRNIYLMNMDGAKRIRIAESGRDACWTADGKRIVYLKDEVEVLNGGAYWDYATKGVFIYDLATGKTTPHANPNLHHLYNIGCTPDNKWMIATVHAGMGFRHGIIAIEANGKGFYNIDGTGGCRPDISPDGKKLAWGSTDNVLNVGDLTMVDGKLKMTNVRAVMTSANPIHIYHIDWSPDSRYVSFSRGPTQKSTFGFAPEVVGIQAKGWDICVADAEKTNRWIQLTTDGNSNKESDWVPVKK